jgi:serine/threonine protein kinase
MATIDFALPDKYKIVSFIDKGAYGCVYSVKRVVSNEDGSESTTELVAIKRVEDYSRRRAICTDDVQLQYTRCITREVEILHTFRDNYEFIEMKDLYLSDDGLDLYIVMPYVPNSLARLIKDPAVSRIGLEESIVRNIVLQIALGLCRMKDRNVMHRDLKPANILVETTGKWNCYLADFGLGRVAECTVRDMTINVVTRAYRPPELLLECPSVDNQVDVWSLGCVMCELLTGDNFLHEKDASHQLAKIIMEVCGPPVLEDWQGRASNAALGYLQANWSTIENAQPFSMQTIIPEASAEAVEVLTKMLQFDPKQRATPSELLEFAWFEDEDSQQEIQYANQVASPTEKFTDIESMSYDELVAHVEGRTTLTAAQVVQVKV